MLLRRSRFPGCSSECVHVLWSRNVEKSWKKPNVFFNHPQRWGSLLSPYLRCTCYLRRRLTSLNKLFSLTTTEGLDRPHINICPAVVKWSWRNRHTLSSLAYYETTQTAQLLMSEISVERDKMLLSRQVVWTSLASDVDTRCQKHFQLFPQKKGQKEKWFWIRSAEVLVERRRFWKGSWSNMVVHSLYILNMTCETSGRLSRSLSLKTSHECGVVRQPTRTPSTSEPSAPAQRTIRYTNTDCTHPHAHSESHSSTLHKTPM